MFADRALRLLLAAAIAGAPTQAFANRSARGQAQSPTGSPSLSLPGALPGLPLQPLQLPDAPLPQPPFTLEFPAVEGARIEAPSAARIDALPSVQAAPPAPTRAEDAAASLPGPEPVRETGRRLEATL